MLLQISEQATRFTQVFKMLPPLNSVFILSGSNLCSFIWQHSLSLKGCSVVYIFKTFLKLHTE